MNKAYTEEMFNKCYGIIAECDNMQQVCFGDEFEDVKDDLLAFVEGFDDMSDDEKEMYSDAMFSAWHEYDGWEYTQGDVVEEN